jgi:hypothetical protein
VVNIFIASVVPFGGTTNDGIHQYQSFLLVVIINKRFLLTTNLHSVLAYDMGKARLLARPQSIVSILTAFIGLPMTAKFFKTKNVHHELQPK